MSTSNGDPLVVYIPFPMLHSVVDRDRLERIAPGVEIVTTPYEVGHDPKKYPFERIFPMVRLAASRDPNATAKLLAGLRDTDSAVRYWAVMGLRMRDTKIVRGNLSVLREALQDPAPSVRIAAAEALGVFGEAADVKAVLAVLTKLADPRTNDVHQTVMALNVLDALGTKATPVLPELRTWPAKMKKASDPRATPGVPRLMTSIMAQLQKTP